MIHLEDQDQEHDLEQPQPEQQQEPPKKTKQQQEQEQQEEKEQQQQQQQQQQQPQSPIKKDTRITITESLEEKEKEKEREKEEEKEEKDPFTPKTFESETSWICCTSYKDKSNFKTILQHLDLTPVQKEIIQTRYLHILQNLQKRARNHAVIHFIGHFVITVGSLLVPALLSIQNSDREFALTSGPFNVHIYWATFTISLLVTMWNAILTLFRIDKKYFFLNTILERLRSEGWQYVSLTGRYSGHLTKGMKPTHKNQFIHFTHYIERVKMKQIEEEYYRTDEKSQAPTTTASTSTSSTSASSGGNPSSSTPSRDIDLHTPSPANPITGIPLSAVPPGIRIAHDMLSRSQPNPALSSTMTQVLPVYDPYTSQGYAASVYSQNPSNPIYYAQTSIPSSVPRSPPLFRGSSTRSRSLSPPVGLPHEKEKRSESQTEIDAKRYPARFRDIRKKRESPNEV